MTTITAKKLRDNLSEYLDRLQNGEEIVIIRHSEVIGSLKPVSASKKANGEAVAAMLDRNKAFFAGNKALTDESVPTKELYHQALNKHYGR
jgi:antitoxin (DNA-binding transcriptional repressor) of toxin-antitoxin stability system